MILHKGRLHKYTHALCTFTGIMLYPWLIQQAVSSWDGIVIVSYTLFCSLVCYCLVIMPWYDFYELQLWFSQTICTHSWFLSNESSSQFVDVSARKSHPVVSRSGMWTKETIMSLHILQACSQDFQCHYLKVGIISCARTQQVNAISCWYQLVLFRHWCIDAGYMLNHSTSPPVDSVGIWCK